MAGFDYEAGRSNNMVAAEGRGMVTIGRWAKRFGVSAAAAVNVMRPAEAHHTGTGRRGKSRLTPVIDGDTEPTAVQVAAMKALDAAAKHLKEAPPTIIRDCVVRYITWPTSRWARRIPTEQVEAVQSVELHADGTIECVDPYGHRTVNWQRLSGLVIAKDGQVVAERNVNADYDDAAAIAARICEEARRKKETTAGRVAGETRGTDKEIKT